MSTNPSRTATIPERRTTASVRTSTARPRVTSRNSTEEQNKYGSSAHTKRTSSVVERRTERTHTYVRDAVTLRAQSPLKQSFDQNGPDIKTRREEQPTSGPDPPMIRSPVVERQPPRGSWTPQATLIPCTTAPLASRTSAPPLASLAPEALQPTNLDELTLDAQESAILGDLLFVFMGFEGQYIRYVDGYDPLDEKDRLAGPKFRILPGLDPSLRDLTASMLKMATHYAAVETFLEVQGRQEYGAVSHAFCAAIRKLLKDYMILMAQLEHQMLTNPTATTLHVLNLHTKSTGDMMFQLYTVTQEVLKRNALLEEPDDSSDSDNYSDILENLREGRSAGDSIKKVCKGGSLLGLITKRLKAMSGDPAARALLGTLLKEASRPYMTMLNEWLHQGGIKDPHGEFLIREAKSISKAGLSHDYTDEYWDKRYTIREEDLPPQLESVKDKVLLAGKYLNVVRECGGVDISKEVRDVPPTFDDPRFLENINAAYSHANSSLLDLLVTTHALPARLRSLKHYFFLDKSDFFSYWLELGTSELRKPVKNVNVPKLQSLLDLVLRQPGSAAAEDPFKEDVKVQMIEMSLTSWLIKIISTTGIDKDTAGGVQISDLIQQQPTSSADDKDLIGFDTLVLDYEVPFPLSLVISRVSVVRYQVLFRFLLSLRHLEVLLVNAWVEHGKGTSWRHKSKDKRIEMWKRRAWTLRARMLIFVQQLLYFCTAEVIEPNWQTLMSRVKEATEGSSEQSYEPRRSKRTVDELMQDHVDFLASCLKECMLTNSKLLRINSKVVHTCNMFASYTNSLSRYLFAADEDLSGAAVGSKSTSTVAHDPAKLDKILDILKIYEENFSRHLRVLLELLNYLAATETVVFMSLCARLSTASEGLPSASNSKT